MKSVFESDAIDTAPDLSTLISEGHPTNGTPSLGIAATKPGAAWFYAVTQEIVNAITALGGEPKADVVNQLATELVKIKDGVIPAGAVLAIATSNIPEGFLLCNGAAVSRTDYARLFEAIGTIYGAGDGETTFNLPDLRDRFIEGAGSNALGTYLEAGLPNITGDISGVSYSNVPSEIKGAFNYLNDNLTLSASQGRGPQGLNFNASRVSPIYRDINTVQPPSLVLNYVIKY